MRKNRDLKDEGQFERFVAKCLERATSGRQGKVDEELKTIKTLEASRSLEFREFLVAISSYCTINICHNIWPVPPRFMPLQVKVRVYEQKIEVWYAEKMVMQARRLLGRSHHQIDYRHVIWSLVRKPGAFARYRYTEDFLISPIFYKAYDAPVKTRAGIGADSEYLRLLHLAATLMQSDVETAIELLLEQTQPLTATAVKELVTPDHMVDVPLMQPYDVDLSPYDTRLTQAVR